MRERASRFVRELWESDRIDNERIAFVTADGFAVPGCLDVRRMLVRKMDVANVIKACPYHHHFLRPLNEIERHRHRYEQEFGHAKRPATRAREENGISGD
jgi:hypothetical protein